MADLNSPVRHRLELLERTIYALQAQQRLLEYRIQHIEHENQTLRQNGPSKPPQAARATSEHTLFQSNTQITTTRAPSGHRSYVSELQALTEDSDTIIGEHARALSSLSLLDAPSLLTTPTLTPTRNVFVPNSTPTSHAKIRYSPLTPSCAEASEFEPSTTSQCRPSTPSASTLIFCSPKSSLIEDVPETRKPDISSIFVPSPKTNTKEQKFAVVPWDGTIAWKFINLYPNQKEEQEAMLNSMDQCDVQDEWFFQYGLRYIPKPTDKDAYRTVRIENLPETTTLDKVLAKIHFGDVFSADLLNTLSITGYHTARVVFLHQTSAEKFCKSVKKGGLFVEGTRAHVTLERTATYPIGNTLKQAIWGGCTRCLTLSEVPEALLGCIEGVIGGTFLKNSVESYYRKFCDDLDEPTSKLNVYVRFHSMRAASYAFKELQKNIFLRNCILRYDSDPCNTNRDM